MKISESILALVRAISKFNYTFDFTKSTELLSEIERLDLSSEQLKLMKNLQSLCKDLERVLIPDTQKLRDLLDTSWATQQEQEKQNLLQLFTPIYSSGYRISDFKKVLIYLAGFTYPSNSSRKEVVENWVVPYIDILLLFFSGVEVHLELVEANKEYIKNY